MKNDNDNRKDLSYELETINDWENPTSKSVSIFEGDKFLSKGFLLKETNKLSLRLPVRIGKDSIEDIIIETEAGQRIFTTLYVNERSTKAEKDGVFSNTLCSIQDLRKGQF